MREDLKKRAYSIGRIALGVALSVGLGWLAVRGLDWSLVLDSLSGISPSLIALAVVVFLAASYLRALRWRILFVDVSPSTNRLFVVQNVGIGLNNLVPIRIASEAAQLAILSIRDRIKPSVALATLGMERVLDLVASAFILAVVFPFAPQLRGFEIYLWGAIAVCVACVILVRLLAWSAGGAARIPRLPFLESFAIAVRDLERERFRLAVALTMSLTYWLMVGVTAWILATSIQLNITPTTATLVILVTIFFATAVPAAPAAIGTFEFAVVYALGLFGVGHEAGFGFAVITHAVFFLPPVIMAAVFLPREGLGSIGGLRSVLSDRAKASADAA